MARRSGSVVALRPQATTLDAAARRFLADADLASTTKRVYRLTLDALTAEHVPANRLPISTSTLAIAPGGHPNSSTDGHVNSPTRATA